MNKKAKWLIVLVLALFVLSGCSSGATQTQEKAKAINIGYLTPLTGRGATYGEIQKIGIDMAVQDINAKGGINGSPINLITEDDQMDPQQSVTMFRKLAGENVVAVIGPFTGACWQNVIPLATQMKILDINLTATLPGIAHPPWAIRTVPSDSYFAPAGVRLFKEQMPKVKRVVIIGDVKEASAAAGVKELQKAATAEGFDVVDTIGFQTGVTDFSPIITKLKSDNPDAVFISSQTAEALGAAKEMQRQGVSVPVLANPLIWAGNFINVVGNAGRNWYTYGYFSNNPDPSNSKAVAFAKTFTERSKSISGVQQPINVSTGSLAYVSVMMLAESMEKANVNANTPIEQARTNTQEAFNAIRGYNGVLRVSMEPNGNGEIPISFFKADTKQGMWVGVK